MTLPKAIERSKVVGLSEETHLAVRNAYRHQHRDATEDHLLAIVKAADTAVAALQHFEKTMTCTFPTIKNGTIVYDDVFPSNPVTTFFIVSS